MNIVFDLGGVIFTWSGEKLIQEFSQSEEIRNLIRTELLDHPDWDDLDRGILAYSEIIKRASERTNLTVTALTDFMNRVPKFLTPIPEMQSLLSRLKQKGHRLFCLSNMHEEVIQYLDKAYDFWPVFEGRVISCYINMIKPEPAIYQYLLNKFNLNPEETIFTDDMPPNLNPASELGIHTILFQDPAQYQSELNKILPNL